MFRCNSLIYNTQLLPQARRSECDLGSRESESEIVRREIRRSNCFFCSYGFPIFKKIGASPPHFCRLTPLSMPGIPIIWWHLS